MFTAMACLVLLAAEGTWAGERRRIHSRGDANDKQMRQLG